MRQTLIPAVAIVATALVLGATAFREQAASAKDKIDSVFVANDAASPVPVTSADDPGRQAFAFFKNDSWGSSEDSHSVTFTVPDGKRLVIESVSIQSALDTAGQKVVAAGVQARVNGQIEDYIMAPVFTGRLTSARDVYTVSQPTTIYADAGTGVLVFAVRDAFNGSGIFNTSVQGHLVDCSAGPCS
jgi:hypothetical protein